MDPSAPIGVFDSGVGGLTVVAALQRLLPRESILYLSDTARLPYGTKSPQTVLAYSRKNVDFLVGRGVKAVVVACNTASAVTLGALQPPVPSGRRLRRGRSNSRPSPLRPSTSRSHHRRRPWGHPATSAP